MIKLILKQVIKQVIKTIVYKSIPILKPLHIIKLKPCFIPVYNDTSIITYKLVNEYYNVITKKYY